MKKPAQTKARRSASIDTEWQDNIDEVIQLINDLHGEGTILMADKTVVPVRFFSTGANALDFALGGGFPEMRMTEIHGPWSSGKTTQALLGARAFLRKYKADEPYVAYLDAENSWDPKYARKLKVPLDRVALIRPNSGEQGINAMVKFMSLRRPILVIIDSIAALTPAEEILSPIEQQTMALQARLINRMMRVCTARLKREQYDEDAPSVTLLALNQLRSKVGVVYGNPETTPGGGGKDFYYSTTIRLSAPAGEQVKQKFTINGITRELRVSQGVNFVVKKNKTGGPQNAEGQMIWQLRDETTGKPVLAFRNNDALLEFGAFHGVVTAGESGGFKYGDFSGGKTAFMNWLQKNPSMRAQLREEIIEAIQTEPCP